MSTPGEPNYPRWYLRAPGCLQPFLFLAIAAVLYPLKLIKRWLGG